MVARDPGDLPMLGLFLTDPRKKIAFAILFGLLLAGGAMMAVPQA
jgi:hypothetical protein